MTIKKEIISKIEDYLLGEINRGEFFRYIKNLSENDSITKGNISDISERKLMKYRLIFDNLGDVPEEKLLLLLKYAQLVRLMTRYLNQGITGEDFVDRFYKEYIPDQKNLKEFEDFFEAINLYVASEQLRKEDPLYFGDERLKQIVSNKKELSTKVWRRMLISASKD